ncbi:unnamed protein product [marine sediment metagenome]|uniref:Beta-galactosidase trimerisation domain-containing protein n=1 Tax=marine sediment metagenome TaxID=412755 RepID=X1PUJ1_9ZZZZ
MKKTILIIMILFSFRSIYSQPELGGQVWNSERTGQFLILPNITALTDQQAASLEEFVKRGNDAFITGLTGLYDEYMRLHSLIGFSLKDLLGAEYRTIRMMEKAASIQFINSSSGKRNYCI